MTTDWNPDTERRPLNRPRPRSPLEGAAEEVIALIGNGHLDEVDDAEQLLRLMVAIDRGLCGRRHRGPAPAKAPRPRSVSGAGRGRKP